jgi:hypothetical protein
LDNKLKVQRTQNHNFVYVFNCLWSLQHCETLVVWILLNDFVDSLQFYFASVDIFFICRFVCLLVCLSVDLSVCWFVCRLVCRSVGFMLVGTSMGGFIFSFVCQFINVFNNKIRLFDNFLNFWMISLSVSYKLNM